MASPVCRSTQDRVGTVAGRPAAGFGGAEIALALRCDLRSRKPCLSPNLEAEVEAGGAALAALRAGLFLGAVLRSGLRLAVEQICGQAGEILAEPRLQIERGLRLLLRDALQHTAGR